MFSGKNGDLFEKRAFGIELATPHRSARAEFGDFRFVELRRVDNWCAILGSSFHVERGGNRREVGLQNADERASAVACTSRIIDRSQENFVAALFPTDDFFIRAGAAEGASRCLAKLAVPEKLAAEQVGRDLKKDRLPFLSKL